tara:strand:+ start:6606 stop:7472 length:867 start_codon:yes stop_codon:yes gene_type:complete
MNIIGSLLKWLWKWQKGSKRMSHTSTATSAERSRDRYLGAREKSMVDDVSDFLQEIRMQDKLPDILRQRNVSVEEFKRLEDLRQLYHRSRDGDSEAQRILNERYSNDPSVYDEEHRMYNEIKDEMHDDADDFLTSPEQKQKKKEEFDAVGNEIIAEQEQISNIQRRWSELAMQDVPQTDERTQALERVRNMMGNARRISNDRETFMGRRGITPSQTRTMADATQWISRSNEELDSIHRGDYRSWADRSMDDMTSDESRPNIFQRMTNSDPTRERNEHIIRNRFTGEDE